MTATVVPSPAVRRVARAMRQTAAEETCADAVLQHLDELHPDEYPALFAVLLGLDRGGRPRIPFTYTPKQRLEGHRLYGQGSEEPWVRAAEREYQRDHRRRARLRKVS